MFREKKDFVEDPKRSAEQGSIDKQIEELKASLATARRTEARTVWQLIQSLEDQKRGYDA